jgi:hypothetical protein
VLQQKASAAHTASQHSASEQPGVVFAMQQLLVFGSPHCAHAALATKVAESAVQMNVQFFDRILGSPYSLGLTL